MCSVLCVSRSGFYEWASRPPSDRELNDAYLINLITQLHAGSGGLRLGLTQAHDLTLGETPRRPAWRCDAVAVTDASRPPIAEPGEKDPGNYKRPTGPPNSWLRPSVLWRSRNDIVARIHDPVDAIREAWLTLQGVTTGPGRADALRITGHEGKAEPSFILLGDTGEGDGSQMALVPGVQAMSAGIDFSVICSDVIYPAGEAADYAAKFYTPYRDIPGPFYAIPGNHDWYDRLVGFMTHFCDARSAPPAGLGRGRGVRGLLARILWRKEKGRLCCFCG